MELLIGVKIGCLFALLALTLVCGLIPICFKWFQIEAATGHHRRVLSFLGCISAGVFLGAGLMHMTAEALEGIELEIQKFMMQNRTENESYSSGDANSAYTIPMESSSSPWVSSSSSFWSRWHCRAVVEPMEDQKCRRRRWVGLMSLDSTVTDLYPHPRGVPFEPSSSCSHSPSTQCLKAWPWGCRQQ
ncbi:zinc transporter ZIP2-like isoform X2 [Phyllostomus hastatus]|uniref:zinc transporter ZIP2-like isoform X2 n=1 Tax=Phyllostomus hastatus TaxID=9423 RepID=UPI001E68083D|nr:zinc transporter ZIP2-like isoform X2 [Phyllostomus hastatus]